MLALELLAWWYGAGWARLARSIGVEINTIIQLFSVPILVRTMFAPWRRLVSAGSRTFQEQLRGLLDNTVSRFVGFMVRSIVLFTAGLIVVIVAVLGAIALLAWPLVPIGGLALLLGGVL